MQFSIAPATAGTYGLRYVDSAAGCSRPYPRLPAGGHTGAVQLVSRAGAGQAASAESVHKVKGGEPVRIGRVLQRKGASFMRHEILCGPFLYPLIEA